MKLAEFSALTFDCYGTLIDWESGIHAALTPLLIRAGANPSGADGTTPHPVTEHAGMGLSRSEIVLTREAVLQAFARLEARQQ